MRPDVAALLSCPHCAGGLTLAHRALRCPRGDAFDLARQGYAALVAGDARGGGDTAAMVAAREGPRPREGRPRQGGAGRRRARGPPRAHGVDDRGVEAVLSRADAVHLAAMGPSARHLEPRVLAARTAALPEPVTATGSVVVSVHRPRRAVHGDSPHVA